MIRTYEEGDLSTGWIGTRVAVSIDGKLHQRYFNRNEYSHERALEDAGILEDKWLKKQALYAKNRVFSSSSNTGITSLRLSYDVTERKGKRYTYNLLRYQSYLNGRYCIRCWFLEDNQISDDDWFDICNTIRNFRGLTTAMFDKLMLKKPTPEKIAKVYSDMFGAMEQKKIEKEEAEVLRTKLLQLKATFS